MVRNALSILLLGVATLGGYAQDYEYVIFPVVAYDVPGGYGSLWSTDLWVYNGSDTTIDFHRDILNVNVDFCVPCEQPPSLAPGESMLIQPNIILLDQLKAMRMLPVRRAVADKITFALRVHDKSRSLLTWGTTIPAVRETDLVVGPLSLLDIPVVGPFRVSLRVYAPRVTTCESVTVRVLSLDTGTEVTSFAALLTDERGVDCIPSLRNSWPASAEFHDLAQMLPSGGPERVRIEIIPTSPDLHYWAMVTVTNDDTQHVTAITPGGNARISQP